MGRLDRRKLGLDENNGYESRDGFHKISVIRLLMVDASRRLWKC
jgi:hypothetical protein